MRQSAAFLAVGLGILFPCIAVQFGGASGDSVSLWAGIGFGLGVSVPAVLDGVLAFGERMAELRKTNAFTRELELKNAGHTVSAIQTPTVQPVILRRIRINDRTGASEIDMPERRPARWIAWQSCIEATLDWAQLRGGITSGVMVGANACFSDRGQWVDVTNVMAAAGLCEKANGRVTRLAGSVDEMRGRVREGRCEWPDDHDPPAHAPAPLSVGVEMAEAR